MTPLAKFFRVTSIPARDILKLQIFRYICILFSKKTFCCARAHTRHIFRPTNMGRGFPKNQHLSKIHYLGVCACCVHTTQKILWENECLIMCWGITFTIWSYLAPNRLHETSINDNIFRFLKKKVQSTFKTRMFVLVIFQE